MRKYWIYFRASLMRTLSYRGQLVLFTIATFLAIVPMVALWMGILQDGAGGYSRAGLIMYYLVGLFIQRLIYSSLINYYVAEVVGDGSIVGLYLVKPVSFYWATFSLGLGWMLIAAVVGLIVSLLFGVTIGVGVVGISVNMIGWTILAMVQAVFIVFATSLILGLISLWTTHISSFVSLYWIGMLSLGGIFIPISFFPSFVQNVVKLLPFRFMFSFPLEILLGKLTGGEIWNGFIVCLAWIALFSLSYKFVWRRGVRAYSGYGQ